RAGPPPTAVQPTTTAPPTRATPMRPALLTTTAPVGQRVATTSSSDGPSSLERRLRARGRCRRRGHRAPRRSDRAHPGIVGTAVHPGGAGSAVRLPRGPRGREGSDREGPRGSRGLLLAGRDGAAHRGPPALSLVAGSHSAGRRGARRGAPAPLAVP